MLRDLPDDFQLEHLNAALAFVKNRALAVDVGAHRGIWTGRMSEVFDNVVAFEPNKKVFDLIPNKSNIYKHNIALGEIAGTVSLKNGKKNTGQTHCVGGNNVCLSTIDHMLNYPAHKPDFIKIDVEGMEFDVLKGAKTTILTHKPLIMIEENGLCERYGHRPDRASKLLKRWGAKKLMTLHMEPEKDVNVLFGWDE